MSNSSVHVAASDHYMRAYLGPAGDVQMLWPKKLSVKELDYMLEVITLQISVFRDSARRESEKEEAARLEYESWFAQGERDEQ